MLIHSEMLGFLTQSPLSSSQGQPEDVSPSCWGILVRHGLKHNCKEIYVYSVSFWDHRKYKGWTIFRLRCLKTSMNTSTRSTSIYRNTWFFLLITYWLALKLLSSNWVYQVNQSKIDQDEGEDTLSSLHFLVIPWRAHIFTKRQFLSRGSGSV